MFFTSGGSEAVESALKLTRAFHRVRGEPGRVKVIARELAYHGTTYGALSATGLPSVRAQFEPLMPGGCHVPHTGLYRCQAGRDPLWAAEAIEQLCSWGRLGTWFGSQRFDYLPDIVTTAKGMTSAYLPMGAMIVSDRVAEPFVSGSVAFAHGLTFGGHPVAAAVAQANLDVLEREDLLGRVRRLEPELRATLEALYELPIVGDVRGAGYFWGIELVADKQTQRPFPAGEAHELTAGFLAPELRRRGLICRAADRGYPVIQLAPPLMVLSSSPRSRRPCGRCSLTPARTPTAAGHW